VNEIRKKKGMTLEQLAEKTGLSVSQISKIENNKRGWSVESLSKLADALGVKVAELIDASDVWQQVPVFGVVEAGGTVIPRKAVNGKVPTRVRAPAAFGELLALIVNNNSLYPRYVKGEVIFCGKNPVEPDECLNRECLVWLEDGNSALRFVAEGTERGRYNLLTHNQTPELNQPLVSCRPVVGRF
jgi:DNA-binding Xre family transcriptional regulator